jgi:predicted Fe-Mo cluster-binding NifX family protein
MAKRIALASSDGRIVDTHFGHAESFYVYEIDGASASFVEKRQVSASCSKRSHDESSFDATLTTLSDCSAIVVSVIGYGAAAYLAGKGMRVFESPYFEAGDVVAKIAADGLLEKGEPDRIKA